jgi:hypothetical protein
MEFQKEILKKIKLISNFLKKEKIDFLVCGGIAFSSLVYPRSTVDLDLILDLKEEELERLKSSLQKRFKGLFINPKKMVFGPVSIFRIVFIEKEKEFIVDFLFLKEEYKKEILKRKIIVNFFKIKLPILSPEDLFLLKKLTKRDRDKDDCEEIKRKYKLNFRYINKWLKKLKE